MESVAARTGPGRVHGLPRGWRATILRFAGERLERIDGVASSQAFAMETREIQVAIDKNALETRNLALDRVLGAATRMNLMIDALLTLARLSSQRNAT